MAQPANWESVQPSLFVQSDSRIIKHPHALVPVALYMMDNLTAHKASDYDRKVGQTIPAVLVLADAGGLLRAPVALRTPRLPFVDGRFFAEASWFLAKVR